MNWIEVLGTRYKAGEVVILSVDSVPTFGLITDIIVREVDDYFLVCNQLHTDCFSHHYHAYEVSQYSTPLFIFVKQPDLASHSVLGLYHKLTTDYVVLKYHIPDNI